ncbi:MAG: HAD-IIIA family hydrolase [Candidatus Omnitrophica bacterium]|nr:HAD-IIIA family hydrolase [Candidatus Omnitrophota bacterium]
MNLEMAKNIELLVVDVDGVLTDGSIVYGNFKDDYRIFNMHDGFGFILWNKAGLKSAIISGKSSHALQRRARELKINLVYCNVKNKLKVFQSILKKFKINPEQACYIGDDLLDLAVLKNAGFSVSVPQACEDIKNCVDYVTQKDAGRGAVREVIEYILKAQNKWQSLVYYYAV